jgi:hypothetical protein
MSLSAAVLNALANAGASREQLLAAMNADIAEREAEAAAKLEKKRRGNRERQVRKRERDSNASSRVTAVTERDARDTPPDVSPKENKQTPSLPPVEVSEPSGSSPQQRPWVLPIGVSLQVWTDFLGNRKRKRLGTSATAWKHFQDDLKRVASQTGIPPPKLIEQCTAKGWGAIYDPGEDNGHGRTNGVGRNQSSDGLSPTTRAAVAVFGAPEASH